MKRLMIGVACAVLLVAVCPLVANAHVIEQGFYNLYGPDYTGDGEPDIWVEVVEKVFNPEQTYDLTGFQDAYLYSYTVINDYFSNPDLWCWGFMEDPTSWGAVVLGYSGPGSQGWYPGNSGWSQTAPNGLTHLWTLNPWDCGCIAGTQAGWNCAPNPGIPKGDSLNTFWLVAKNPPYKMVEAFFHDGSPRGDCDGGGTFVYGKISAPTPEPFSVVLLALGLPAAMLARKRRRET